MYECMRACMYICVHARMYVRTYACTYVRTYVHTCVHAYILTKLNQTKTKSNIQCYLIEASRFRGIQNPHYVIFLCFVLYFFLQICSVTSSRREGSEESSTHTMACASEQYLSHIPLNPACLVQFRYFSLVQFSNIYPISLSIQPACMQGLGFRVQGLKFRGEGLGFRVQGLGFRVWGLGFRVQGWVVGCRVQVSIPDPSPSGLRACIY